jgi:hypothetical protein
MKGTAAVTLSNENGPSRSRPSAHLQPPADAAVRAAHSRQPGRSGHPDPCRPTARRADAPAWSSDEPALLGLRAYRVDLTRRDNDRSTEREE